MQRCPNCGGGELKIIAAILERPVIERILSHLGLDPQPPSPESGARGGARLRYLSRADRQRYLAPGCADNGSHDGAAPPVGSMPMYSGSTLMVGRSEPQSNHNRTDRAGRITTRQWCRCQFQAVQDGDYRPPMRQSGFPQASRDRLKSLCAPVPSSGTPSGACCPTGTRPSSSAEHGNFSPAIARLLSRQPRGAPSSRSQHGYDRPLRDDELIGVGVADGSAPPVRTGG